MNKDKQVIEYIRENIMVTTKNKVVDESITKLRYWNIFIFIINIFLQIVGLKVAAYYILILNLDMLLLTEGYNDFKLSQRASLKMNIIIKISIVIGGLIIVVFAIQDFIKNFSFNNYFVYCGIWIVNILILITIQKHNWNKENEKIRLSQKDALNKFDALDDAKKQTHVNACHVD